MTSVQWIGALGVVVDEPGHAELRATIARCLETAAGFAGALAAMRRKAMAAHGAIVAAQVVEDMRRAEAGMGEALRAARALASKFHGELHVEDAAAWDAAIRSAEAALDAATRALQAEPLVEGGCVSDAATRRSGAAILGLAWALADLPVALRVLRVGRMIHDQAPA